MKIYKIPSKFLHLLPVIFIIFVSILLFIYVDPQILVDFIGLENAYLMMFLTAFLGGLSTFNFIPYYSIIILLVNAGLNPGLVGLSSALGVVCGDTFSYFLGYSSGNIIPESYKTIIIKISDFAKRRPRVFLFATFIYGCVSPLSNDFITISAGMAKIPYIKVMPPLALGNLIFNISLSYLTVYGFQYLNIFF